MNHDIEPNSVDLIYLDPPFFTGKVQKGIAKWQPGAMEVSYEDSKKFWGDTEKVNAMRTKSPEWLRHIAQSRPDFASYLFYMMERVKTMGNHPTTQSREYRENWQGRRRTYRCRSCFGKFRVDTVSALPEKERICPICKSKGYNYDNRIAEKVKSL
jgi:rubrerythrin